MLIDQPFRLHRAIAVGGDNSLIVRTRATPKEIRTDRSRISICPIGERDQCDLGLAEVPLSKVGG
jgi:hypothetical protein